MRTIFSARVLVTSAILLAAGIIGAAIWTSNRGPIPSETAIVFGVDPLAPVSAAEARFNYPEDAIEAPDGSIYVSDTHSHAIRRIKDGVAEIFAGTLNKGYNGDGNRLDVNLDMPTALALSPDGASLIFADSGNALLRQVDIASGNLNTIAGKPGNPALPGNGAVAASAPIGYVPSLKWDSDGNLWFPSAYIENGVALDGGLFCLTPDGIVKKKKIDVPFPLFRIRDLAVSDEHIDFVQDSNFFRYYKNGSHKKVVLGSGYGKGIEQLGGGTLVGSHTTLVSLDDELKASTVASGFANISNIKPAAEGFLITDSDQGAIYSLQDGKTIQLTGSKESSYGALIGVAKYGDSEILVLDNQKPRIFLVNLRTGESKLWAGTGAQGWASINVDKLKTNFYYPAAIAVDARKNVYVAEQHRIMKIDVDGQVSLFAGYETPGDKDSLVPTEARMQSIRGMAFDAAGNMYVADTYNNKVRKIFPDGEVKTFAGTGEAAAPVLNERAENSPLNRPHAVLALLDGTVLIADSWNNAVIRIDHRGTVRPFAGSWAQSIYQGMGALDGDGGPAHDAKLNTPIALARGEDGSVFIADNFNHRIRVVSPDGRISTFAGETQGFAPMGKLLNFPYGLEVVSGGLYVADSGNRLIVRYRLP